MPIMMLIVEILLIIIGIKWKTWKQTENCRKNQKIPAANRKLAARKLKTFWKQQDLFCFFSKKLPSPLPNSRNRQKSGHQGGQTAPKWLDNTVKPCPKISWRNRRFSTIQQRKKPVTSFLSQAYGADEGIWTHTLLRELEPESSASASSATSAYFVWPPHRRRILL